MRIFQRNKRRQNFKFLFFLSLLLVIAVGCQGNMNITRENFSETLSNIGKKKYQAYISCTDVGDTVWIYLPYTPGRRGYAVVKEKGKDLYVEHDIASFNPYKTINPPELKFLVQRILGEIRKLLLHSVYPYKFFVLVITDIESPINKFEDWYIGHIDDVKKYGVGADFSGEGYSRLVWHQEKIETKMDNEGKAVSKSYLDTDGMHINYRDITLKEFVEKQIEWRIYKRFTINYNKIPYDLTVLERQEEVINIVKKVLTAYNFREFDKLYLNDVSFEKVIPKVHRGYDVKEFQRSDLVLSLFDFLIKKQQAIKDGTASEQQSLYYIGCFLKDLDKLRIDEVKRKPAF